jgi:methylated-DNA-[protein]-cysteine S-methyltransferase
MNATHDEPVVSALRDLSPTEPDPLDRLHRALAASAAREGLLQVAYRTIDSPVGPLLLAATEAGLVRVAFAREDHDRVLDTLATRLSPRILRSPERLDRAAFELDEYFNGARIAFDLPLDRTLSRGFRRAVQERLPAIAYGHTLSYARLAQLAGNPKAVRAAATACATNPLPIVVPCHRVVRADGSLGRYVGGPEAKSVLLNLESAA